MLLWFLYSLHYYIFSPWSKTISENGEEPSAVPRNKSVCKILAGKTCFKFPEVYPLTTRNGLIARWQYLRLVDWRTICIYGIMIQWCKDRVCSHLIERPNLCIFFFWKAMWWRFLDIKTGKKTNNKPRCMKNIGFAQGVFSDGRPFHAESWATDGATHLTFFFSNIDIENYQ